MATVSALPDAGAIAPRPRPTRWLRLAGTAALLAILLAMVDLATVGRVVASARPDLLLGMLALFVLERVFAAYRWLVLLRVAEPGIRFWPVLRITFVSNFLGAFLPGTVGIEVLRVYGVGRLLADLPLALTSVVVERLCGTLALLIWIGLGLLLAPIALPAALDVVLGAGFACFAVVLAALLHGWPRQVARQLLAAVGLTRLRDGLILLERRLDAYARRPRTLTWSLGLAFAFQLLRIATIAVGALALGITVNPLLFLVIVPVTILITLLPISIGGIGARQASYVALLGLAGVAPDPALVLGLTREVLNLAATLPGAVCHVLHPVRVGVQGTA